MASEESTTVFSKSPAVHRQLTFSAAIAPVVYACFVYTAFFLSISSALTYHYGEVVKTACKNSALYEWLPSLSAVIGDHNPERFLFRLFMWPSVSCRLLMTGSHFLMFQNNAPQSTLQPFVVSSYASSNRALVYVDLLRIVAATGWIVISSRDAMLLHVGSFVAYIVSSLLGGLLQLYLLSCIVDRVDGRRRLSLSRSFLWKKVFLGIQILSLPLAGYWFYHHEVYCADGAYSQYNLWEWVFSFANVAYDATAYWDFVGQQVVTLAHQGERKLVK